jgi:hypothetical protein
MWIVFRPWDDPQEIFREGANPVMATVSFSGARRLEGPRRPFSELSRLGVLTIQWPEWDKLNSTADRSSFPDHPVFVTENAIPRR